MENKIVKNIVKGVAITTLAFGMVKCGGDDEKPCDHEPGTPVNINDYSPDVIYACGYDPIDPNIPVERTESIVFEAKGLTFDVKFKDLLSAPVPDYVGYLEERIGILVNSEEEETVEMITSLMNKGRRFTINVEYTGNTPGISWDTATQSFKIYNDWISTASGTNLSLGTIFDAFESVDIVVARSTARDSAVAQFGRRGVQQYAMLDRAMHRR